MIRRFFQRDNMIFGILMGAALPALVYGILYLIFTKLITGPNNPEQPLIKASTLQLICIFANLAILRYYLLRLKFDYTGRGILLSTLIYAIIYFSIHI